MARKKKDTTPLSEEGKRLVLSNALIRGTSCRLKAKEGAATRIWIGMTATLNAEICGVMDWDEPAKGCGNGGLLGKLHCTYAIFNPNNQSSKAPEIQFDTDIAQDFTFRREFDAQGGVKRSIMLDFTLIAQGPNSIETVDQFFAVWGHSMGTLTLTYSMKTGKQEALPGTEDDAQGELLGEAAEEEFAEV